MVKLKPAQVTDLQLAELRITELVAKVGPNPDRAGGVIALAVEGKVLATKGAHIAVAELQLKVRGSPKDSKGKQDFAFSVDVKAISEIKWDTKAFVMPDFTSAEVNDGLFQLMYPVLVLHVKQASAAMGFGLLKIESNFVAHAARQRLKEGNVVKRAGGKPKLAKG